MTLPFSAVVEAMKSGGSGRISIARLATSVTNVRSVMPVEAATLLSSLTSGPVPEPATIRELVQELSSMTEGARALACVLGPALIDFEREGALVSKALLAIASRCSAVIGAFVPRAVIIDATLLESCRASGAQWSVEAITREGGTQRVEELARRVARAIGLKIEGETAAQSAAKLRQLDLAIIAESARAAEIEAKLRATLPEV